MRAEIEQFWRLAEPVVEDAGLELVEVEWGRDGEGWVLRMYVDRPAVEGGLLDGAADAGAGAQATRAVGHEDCARISHDVSAVLDVADAVRHAYRLEVSSPGVERPLRRERDFRRFAGARVRVRTAELVGGRRNFSGTLRAAGGGTATVDCDGQAFELPLDAIAKANLIPDWDALFHRTPHRSAS